MVLLVRRIEKLSQKFFIFLVGIVFHGIIHGLLNELSVHALVIALYLAARICIQLMLTSHIFIQHCTSNFIPFYVTVICIIHPRIRRQPQQVIDRYGVRHG